MRVIGGTAKSLRLLVPKGVRLRPTSDAMRETLFNILAGAVAEGPFLDIYAGTGSVGIEALSRGSPRCVFIERNRRCVEAIAHNLANTGLSDLAAVIRGDAERVVTEAIREYGPFRIIFVDPPYDDPGGAKVAAGLLASEALDAGGRLVLQHSRRSEAPGLPDPQSVRRFGETELLFFSAQPKER